MEQSPYVEGPWPPLVAEVPPEIEAAARAWLEARAEDERLFRLCLKSPHASPDRERLLAAFAAASNRKWEAGAAVEAALGGRLGWYPVDGWLVGLVGTRFGLSPRIKPGYSRLPRPLTREGAARGQ